MAARRDAAVGPSLAESLFLAMAQFSQPLPQPPARVDHAQGATGTDSPPCPLHSETDDMKALVYRGPGFKALEDRPKPVLAAPGDAIVRITRTTICGTDLHILKGDVPSCTPGRILGHEGVGV